MDSDTDAQEPAGQADSGDSVQEDEGSRTDNSGERINGLMSLVGKRTQEATTQKTRAEKAEAQLAAALERLVLYERGAEMSDTDTEALAADQMADGSTEAEQEESPDSTDSGEENFWFPGPYGESASTYVDPNSASRQSPHPDLTPSKRLQSAFAGGLDDALEHWGWKEPVDQSKI